MMLKRDALEASAEQAAQELLARSRRPSELEDPIAENNVREGRTNFLKTAKLGNHFPTTNNNATPTRNSMDNGVQCIIV